MITVRTDPNLTSWGRVRRTAFRVARPQFIDELPAALGHRPRLAIGARRSYGDTNLSADAVLIDMTGLNRLIAFDLDLSVNRAREIFDHKPQAGNLLTVFQG